MRFTVATAVDPILVTEVSVVFSAVALPLTYLPILVVANDPDYMGEHVNGRIANALGTVYLVVIAVGLPLVASAGGWLMAGREPAAVSS